MKKLVIILVMVLGLLLPVYAKAATTSLNLKEALQEEEIELDKAFDSYKETDDQAIVYLFRGNGCGYCRAFLTFLNSIVGEYGKYFKVVSYEVWYNSENSALLDSVSAYLNNPAQGVPYIVIGDKVFAGYAESYDEDIKSTIKALYDTDKDDRYDVLTEMEDNPNKEDKGAIKASNKLVILTAIIASVVIIGSVIAFTNYKFTVLENEIAELKSVKAKVVEEKKEKVEITETKEKKPAKKTAKRK